MAILYCFIPNRAVICISQFKMPTFSHLTVLTHFQEPKKLLFWEFQGRIHSLHLKFCMPCLGCNHQVISGSWLDYFYIIKLDTQVPERLRVAAVNTESQVPDRWWRAAWTGGGREDGEEGLRGTWGSHLPFVTPTSWCHRTIGWVSHTCGTQVRPRIGLNLDSPPGQCREEAGLTPWKDGEGMNWHDKSESSWKLKGLYKCTVSLSDLVWLRQVWS